MTTPHAEPPRMNVAHLAIKDKLPCKRTYGHVAPTEIGIGPDVRLIDNEGFGEANICQGKYRPIA